MRSGHARPDARFVVPNPAGPGRSRPIHHPGRPPSNRPRGVVMADSKKSARAEFEAPVGSGQQPTPGAMEPIESGRLSLPPDRCAAWALVRNAGQAPIAPNQAAKASNSPATRQAQSSPGQTSGPKAAAQPDPACASTIAGNGAADGHPNSREASQGKLSSPARMGSRLTAALCIKMTRQRVGAQTQPSAWGLTLCQAFALALRRPGPSPPASVRLAGHSWSAVHPGSAATPRGPVGEMPR